MSRISIPRIQKSNFDFEHRIRELEAENAELKADIGQAHVALGNALIGAMDFCKKHATMRKSDVPWPCGMCEQSRAEAAKIEVEQWKDLHKAIAQLENQPENWPSHGNAPLAIAASYSLLKSCVEDAQEKNLALVNENLALKARLLALVVTTTGTTTAMEVVAVNELQAAIKEQNP